MTGKFWVNNHAHVLMGIAEKLDNYFLMNSFPPFPIQQKIAQILKAVDDKISAEEKKKEALQTFFKTMLHHLMTGKIKVKY